MNNGDTLSVTYIAFHPFQIDTTKMAVNKIAGRLTKQEIDIFKNFSEVYKFADEGPKEELYVLFEYFEPIPMINYLDQYHTFPLDPNYSHHLNEE